MKTIIAILTFSILLFSCSNRSASVSNGKDDTTRTLLAYRLPDSSFHIELGWRITKAVQQFKITDSDSTTAKKQLVRDSFYLVPNPDSARIGKLVWAFCPKEFILIDGGKNVDTLFKKYSLHFPRVVIDNTAASSGDQTVQKSSKQVAKK